MELALEANTNKLQSELATLFQYIYFSWKKHTQLRMRPFEVH